MKVANKFLTDNFDEKITKIFFTNGCDIGQHSQLMLIPMTISLKMFIYQIKNCIKKRGPGKEEGLRIFFRGVRQIRHIKIGWGWITGQCFECLPPELRSLELMFCKDLASKWLDLVAERCLQLHSLRLTGCKVNDEQLLSGLTKLAGCFESSEIC